MKALLIGELAFCGVLVVGCIATLDSPLTSLRAWVLACYSVMLLWYVGAQALVADRFWLTFLAVAMGLKVVYLVRLIQDRTAQKRRIKLEAIADASQRNFVHSISNLCLCVDGGRTEGDSVEVSRAAEAASSRAAPAIER